MKCIKNTLTVVALCGMLTTIAKQVGSKTTAQPQPKPNPTPYVQPTPRPYVQPKPAPYYPQPQAGPTYTEILSSLKSKTPDSSDISTLNNIKNEAERQINFIKKTVARQPIRNIQDLLRQVENPVKEVFQKYPVNFNKTQQQINDASKNDTDIFTEEEQTNMTAALFNIVKGILDQFPTLNSQEIYEIIIALHPEFKTFQNKLNTEQREDVNKFLKAAVDLAYKIIIQS